MSRQPVTQIDESKCTGCGLCVKVCPADTLEVVDGICKVTGKRSLHCAQCVAVCPEGAVSVDEVSDRPLITEPDDALVKLIDIMKSRRSCRSYKKKPVDEGILRDLVTIGATAPSGTNQQRWAFTILKDRDAMEQYAHAICGFYKRLNRMANSGVMRLSTKLFAKDILGRYYRRYYDQVKNAIEDWEESGRDRLFHHAPAGIVVSCHKGASTPSEDALLATQNILLAAEAMGLGTCLVGFAVTAMQRDKRVTRAIGIPDDETAYAVIALGYPAVKYTRPSGRKVPTVRFV